MHEQLEASPDRELVERFKSGGHAGRREAFCTLYERHAGRLCAYLTGLTRSPHVAEDLAQDAFLRALNGLDGFSQRSSFRTWLYRIATNLWTDHLRRDKAVLTDGAVQGGMSATAPSPAEIVQTDDEARRLWEAIDALPGGLRAPLVLVRFEGMKYREAADVLGLTMDAVRMRIHRAHMALVAALVD